MQMGLIYSGAPLFYMENFRKNILCLYLESKLAVLEKLRKNYRQNLAFRVGFGAVRAKFASFGPKKSKKIFISPRGCVVALQTDPSFNAEAWGLPPRTPWEPPNDLFWTLKIPDKVFGPRVPPKTFSRGQTSKMVKNQRKKSIFFGFPITLGTLLKGLGPSKAQN